jgi:hypothetical protein
MPGVKREAPRYGGHFTVMVNVPVPLQPDESAQVAVYAQAPLLNLPWPIQMHLERPQLIGAGVGVPLIQIRALGL